jgi:transposase
MELLHSRCAGLDVHKDSVVACVRLAEGGAVTHEVRTFKATTDGLLSLAAWLAEQHVTHAVMESTGVYWKPVWHLLDDGDLQLSLANARHVRNVPGRKTDVNDATWLADLLAHGLLRDSFVPPAPIQQMRDLTRTRKQLIRERAQHIQRIQKVLQDANLKLDSVLTHLMGASGRAMLGAIVAGQSDPAKLAELARGNARKKKAALVEALTGKVTAHHRELLKLHLGLYDALSKAIGEVDVSLGKVLAPMKARARLLTTIPGVSDWVAQVLIAEIGLDMTRFPTAAHLISWAGLCPRCDESAGKRHNTRIREGAPWLKATLVQAAWAAIRTQDSYLRAQFYRLKAKRGAKKAILAVAASMLTAAWHMLRDGVEYQDLGGDYFVQRDKSKVAGRLVRRLQDLGYEVDIKTAA